MLNSELDSEGTNPDIRPDILASDTLPPVSLQPISLPPADEITAEYKMTEQTPDERKAERDNRIATVVARVLPGVKALKIGYDPKQPWLSNPHLEATVKATIEVLYDLDVTRHG